MKGLTAIISSGRSEGYVSEFERNAGIGDFQRMQRRNKGKFSIRAICNS
jgi:hypothetical protein